MANKYVEKSEIIKQMIFYGFRHNMTVTEIIDNLPVADVEEVKHGKWIDTGAYTNHYEHIYECSNCHNEVADDFIVKHTYCLHCGAKMDGKEETK